MYVTSPTQTWFGASGSKSRVEHVRRDRDRVVRVGRAPESALLPRLEAVLAHQPLDALLAHADALRCAARDARAGCRRCRGCACASPRSRRRAARRCLVLGGSGALPPRVVAAARDAEHPAHRLTGKATSFAAMKANFTRSPSRRRWPLLLKCRAPSASRLFSRRSRVSSSRSARRQRLRAGPCRRPRPRASPTHAARSRSDPGPSRPARSSGRRPCRAAPPPP